MTLAAVAEKLDRSHSNIIHHFGSAERLQTEVMSMMVEDLARSLREAIETVGPGEARVRALVDAVFDAFDRGGAGVLAAWIVLSNRRPDIEPVRAAVEGLARRVDERIAQEGIPVEIASVVLFLSLYAFADSLIGEKLCRILSRDSDAAREIAVELIAYFFAAAG